MDAQTKTNTSKPITRSEILWDASLKTGRIKAMALQTQSEEFGEWNHEIRESYAATMADMADEIGSMIETLEQMDRQEAQHKKEKMHNSAASNGHSSLEDISHAFSIAIGSVQGTLDLIQYVSEGHATSLKPGSISGAADSALRMTEEVQRVFDSLLDSCKKAESVAA
jgi:hypothetical protein